MRYYQYVVLTVGILVLLNLAGFDSFVTGTILDSAGVDIGSEGNATLENIKGSNLYGSESDSNSKTTTLYWILAVGITAGVVAGLFGRAPQIQYITGGFVLAITGLLIGDLVSIYKMIAGFGDVWVTAVATLMFTPLVIVLIVKTVEFWQGGTD